MITLPSAHLRALTARIAAFYRDTVELCADADTLYARLSGPGVEARLSAPVTGDGVEAIVVSAADLKRAAGTMYGVVTLAATKAGLLLTTPGTEIVLSAQPEIGAARVVAGGAGLLVHAPTFATAFDRVGYAAALDGNRYGICGMMIESVPGGGRMVAADGNRLAYAEIRDYPAECCLRPGYMLPRWLFAAIRSEIANVADLRIGIWYDPPPPPAKLGTGWIQMETERATITASLLMCEFPDYRAVLPSAPPSAVVLFDRNAAQRAIKTASLYGPICQTTAGRSRSLSVTIGAGAVVFSAATEGEGRAASRLPAGVTGSIPPIGLGHRFVLDALDHLPPGPVEMAFSTVLGPVLLRTLTDRDSGLAVVMPVRLD